MAIFFKVAPFDFDFIDYYEFYWMFERSQKEIEKRNNEQAGMTSIDSAFN